MLPFYPSPPKIIPYWLSRGLISGYTLEFGMEGVLISGGGSDINQNLIYEAGPKTSKLKTQIS